jgi:hypothetical protein
MEKNMFETTNQTKIVISSTPSNPWAFHIKNSWKRRQEKEVVGGLRRFQAPCELLRRQRVARVARVAARRGAKKAGTTGEGLG